MPEADDHRAAEFADAVRKQPQIAVEPPEAIFWTEARVGSHCKIVIAPCLLTVSANEVSNGSLQPL